VSNTVCVDLYSLSELKSQWIGSSNAFIIISGGLVAGRFYNRGHLCAFCRRWKYFKLKSQAVTAFSAVGLSFSASACSCSHSANRNNSTKFTCSLLYLASVEPVFSTDISRTGPRHVRGHIRPKHRRDLSIFSKTPRSGHGHRPVGLFPRGRRPPHHAQ
jgi:hypothetical protein